MKKLIYLYAIITMVVMSSCGYQINHCPTYSHHNQLTRHGTKAQAHYHKKKAKHHSIFARN
jgi:hypothetical protein